MKVAIVWGSTTGNTENAADALKTELGDMVDVCCSVNDITAEDMNGYDVVLIGASTWDIGELQYDWPDRVEEMGDLDWSSVHVGFFGCGDAVGYDETFVDAFGLIWEVIEPQGAKLIGKVPVEGYEFSGSKALCDDDANFLGLPLDDDNEPELTEGRIQKWAEQLKSEIGSISQPA